MPKIYCDAASCRFCNTNDECERDVVYFSGEMCGEYEDYAEWSPEYQEIYYAQVREYEGKNRKKEVHLKRMKKGKKYEFFGYTFYTSNDDRRGIDNCYFTEKTSGVGIRGSDLKRTDIDVKEKIQKGIDLVQPVDELQDYDEWEDKRLKESLKSWQKG